VRLLSTRHDAFVKPVRSETNHHVSRHAIRPPRTTAHLQVQRPFLAAHHLLAAPAREGIGSSFPPSGRFHRSTASNIFRSSPTCGFGNEGRPPRSGSREAHSVAVDPRLRDSGFLQKTNSRTHSTSRERNKRGGRYTFKREGTARLVSVPRAKATPSRETRCVEAHRETRQFQDTRDSRKPLRRFVSAFVSLGCVSAEWIPAPGVIDDVFSAAVVLSPPARFTTKDGYQSSGAARAILSVSSAVEKPLTTLAFGLQEIH